MGRPAIDDGALLEQIAELHLSGRATSVRGAVIAILNASRIPIHSTDSAVRRLQRKWCKQATQYLGLVRRRHEAEREDVRPRQRRRALGIGSLANIERSLRLTMPAHKAAEEMQRRIDELAGPALAITRNMERALEPIQRMQRDMERLFPFQQELDRMMEPYRELERMMEPYRQLGL